jgi:hypothetical protein
MRNLKEEEDAVLSENNLPVSLDRCPCMARISTMLITPARTRR